MGRTLFLPTSLKIVAAVGAAFVLWGLVLASPAYAETYTVNSTADTTDSDGCTTASGGCTLREAINAANSSSGVADTIDFDLEDSPATITLDSSLGQLPSITDADGLTIDGGDAEITVSGGDTVRVFEVARGAKLALENLTVSHGFADGETPFDEFGGGAATVGGTLTISNSTFSDNNSFTAGGGVATEQGTVIVTDSIFSDNSAEGGVGGGGIYNRNSSTTVTNSTFSNNTTPTAGGGILNNNDSTLTVTNSTFSGNIAENHGGGIDNAGTATVSNSTFAANSAFVGDSIYQFPDAPPATLKNTIVANSASGGDCGGKTITDGGYNHSSDDTCGFSTANNSLPGKDPKLGDLADNGGPTKTHALLTGSPAIDAGPPVVAADVNRPSCPPPATDQRGVSRPQGSACDIGSFEFENHTPVASGATETTNEDTPKLFTLAASDSDSGTTLTYKVTALPTDGKLYKGDATDPLNQTSDNRITSVPFTLPSGANQLTYVPNPNYNNTLDTADFISFKANDGTVDSNEATVKLVVNAVNDVPVAANDSYSTGEDTNLAIAAPGVLANDADAGDTKSTVLVSQPSHGTLDPALAADGSFTYKPAANYHGPDSFTYKANDDTADSEVVTVSITVNSVNDPPKVEVAAATSCGTNDRSGTITLSVSDVDSPVAGLTLAGASNNKDLVPNANLAFAGTSASRTLTATALSGKSGTAVLTVTVTERQQVKGAPLTVNVRVGGNGNDTLVGDANSDILLGQNGDDTLRGVGGKDLLCGARGNDRLTGGTGADYFSGGSGTDTATDFTTSQGDTMAGIP